MSAAGAVKISLDELIALNDEMASLVRAGMPLGAGLVDIGRDMPGRLGEMMKTIGTRIVAGESLSEAFAAEGQTLPRIYRAVFEAGLKSGRLSAALEGLTQFARGYVELRRVVGLALLYPLLVFTLAYGLFLMFVSQIAPRLLAVCKDFGVPKRALLVLLNEAGETAIVWGPVVPVLLLVMVCGWIASGRAAALQSGWFERVLRRLPWTGTVLASSKAANFAELLALLVDQQVPLHEGVLLAAESTGDPRLIEAARELAAAIQRGDSLPDGLRAAHQFPPVLRWLMVSGHRQQTLVSALRHAAETYRRRAANRADLARLVFPTLAMLLIGAVVTLLYGLMLFVPMTTLLRDLTAD